MKQITIATCLEQPHLQPSDAVLAAALCARGVSVSAAPWNGDQAAFIEADAIVIRSTWDYQKAPQAFASWLDGLGAAGVFNVPALMRWNMSKRYLVELAQAGVATPPLQLVEPNAAAITAAMDALELAEAVVKPEYGATASGLSAVARSDPAGIAAAAEKMAMPGLVQALVPEITNVGETSLIFIDGAYSHAVTKRPKSGEIRCQAEFGGVTDLASPPDWAVDAARHILTLLPEPPLYARIDGILLDGRLQLMEVELIEPELFFTYCPEGADRLAAALAERL